MYSTLANGFMGFVMMIGYCYCIGDILEGTLCPRPSWPCELRR